MKFYSFIFFILIILNIENTYSRNPICPPEDYPQHPYESKEADGITDLSIDVCLDEIGIQGECEGCCITVYYFKRLIPPDQNFTQRVDIMLDYISNPEEEDCYWCNRVYAADIIKLIHMKILEKHSLEYGLRGNTWNYNHLVLRANCMEPVNQNGKIYWQVCEIDITSCCFKTAEFTMNLNGEITYYSLQGDNYYSWPPEFECPPTPCQKKCGQLAGLDVLAVAPKISISDYNNEQLLNGQYLFGKNDEIVITNESNGLYTLLIMDYTGTLVKKSNLNKNQLSIRVKLGTEALPRGLYFLIVTHNSKVVSVQKIIR